VKVRCRESILVRGRENVGVKVDDHIRFTLPFGLINKAFLDLEAWKFRLAASERGVTPQSHTLTKACQCILTIRTSF
jgi:hypothetical protein